MKGITLLENPQQFPSFCLAHRVEGAVHHFQVAYGSYFFGLHYDFTPQEFISSADRSELVLQLRRAGASWVLDVMEALASGGRSYTGDQLVEIARANVAAG